MKKTKVEGLSLVAGVIELLAGAVIVAAPLDGFVLLQVVGWALVLASFARFANRVLRYHWPKSRVLGMMEFAVAAAIVIASMASVEVCQAWLWLALIIEAGVCFVGYNLWATRASWLVSFGAGAILLIAGISAATGSLDAFGAACALVIVRGAADALLSFFRAKD